MIFGLTQTFPNNQVKDKVGGQALELGATPLTLSLSPALTARSPGPCQGGSGVGPWGWALRSRSARRGAWSCRGQERTWPGTRPVTKVQGRKRRVGRHGPMLQFQTDSGSRRRGGRPREEMRRRRHVLIRAKCSADQNMETLGGLPPGAVGSPRGHLEGEAVTFQSIQDSSGPASSQYFL